MRAYKVIKETLHKGHILRFTMWDEKLFMAQIFQTEPLYKDGENMAFFQGFKIAPNMSTSLTARYLLRHIQGYVMSNHYQKLLLSTSNHQIVATAKMMKFKDIGTLTGVHYTNYLLWSPEIEDEAEDNDKPKQGNMDDIPYTIDKYKGWDW